MSRCLEDTQVSNLPQGRGDESHRADNKLTQRHLYADIRMSRPKCL